MSTDAEFNQWRSAWNAAAEANQPAAVNIGAIYRRQERRLRIEYALNLVAAIVLVSFAAWFLHANYRAEVLAWAVAVWLTTLAATAFHVWNWRALWKRETRSVVEYAQSFERRSVAILRAVRFGYILLMFQLAIAVPWLTWDLVRGRFPFWRYALGIGLLGFFSAGFIAWFRRVQRRTALELTDAREFRRGLCADEESGTGT